MRVAVIDNYDSFTYNLVHYLEEICSEVKVFRNDAAGATDLDDYSHIVISPGPGLPKEAGSTMKVINRYHSSKKILGVCLGMQAIAEYFGGELYNLPEVLHGVDSECRVTDKTDILYREIPETFRAGHYHSWAVKTPLPDRLILTAINENGIAMSLKHERYDIHGVQYHPESLLTPVGKSIIKNWMLKI